MKKICVVNQKGGVAKTTTAVNLAVGLSLRKHDVLLIDLDPQGNATSHLIKKKPDVGMAELLRKEKTFDDLVHTGNESDILPAGKKLILLERDWSKDVPGSFTNLRDTLKLSGYDYVIIDGAPSLGSLVMNALTFADEVIVPIKTDYFSLEGLSEIISTIDSAKKYNPGLKLIKILPTFYDVRNTISDYVLDEVKKHFSKELAKSRIRINVSLAEAPAYSKSIFDYAPRSHGAEDYEQFVKEIERVK